MTHHIKKMRVTRFDKGVES